MKKKKLGPPHLSLCLFIPLFFLDALSFVILIKQYSTTGKGFDSPNFLFLPCSSTWWDFSKKQIAVSSLISWVQIVLLVSQSSKCPVDVLRFWTVDSNNKFYEPSCFETPVCTTNLQVHSLICNFSHSRTQRHLEKPLILFDSMNIWVTWLSHVMLKPKISLITPLTTNQSSPPSLINLLDLTTLNLLHCQLKINGTR